MPSPNTSIRAAFVSHLKMLPSLPQTAWENVPFDNEGNTYLKPVLLPGEPTQAEIGYTGRNRHVGVYQVSVLCPSGTGVAEINALKDSIVDHFKRGTVITYGYVNVSITKAFAGPMIEGTEWIHCPVTIQYQLLADN